MLGSAVHALSSTQVLFTRTWGGSKWREKPKDGQKELEGRGTRRKMRGFRRMICLFRSTVVPACPILKDIIFVYDVCDHNCVT